MSSSSSARQRIAIPQGSPAMLRTWGLAALPAIALSVLLGLSSLAIISGLVSVFTLIALSSGALRADLKAATILGPLIAAATIVPRLLADFSRPAAIAALTCVLFLAGLMPIRGSRYVMSGMGLGMASIFAYGYPASSGTAHHQVVLASCIGVITAVLVRIARGLRDPSAALRSKVADLLDTTNASTPDAYELWLMNGRPKWIELSLSAASRFRLAMKSAVVAERHTAPTNGELTKHIDAIGAYAQAVAERVRVREPNDSLLARPSFDVDAQPRPFAGLFAAALDALDQIQVENSTRDPARVGVKSQSQRSLDKAISRYGLTWRSTYMRHALRVALGMSIMLCLVTRLPPGDTLSITTLMMSFSILQVSWRATLAKVKDRVLGVICGALAVMLVVTLLPPQTYVYIAAAAFLLGLWFVATTPKLGYALFVLVSIEMGVSLRGRVPLEMLGEYGLLTAAAVLVSLVVGFAVVPSQRPKPLAVRIRRALEHTTETCAAISEGHHRASVEVIGVARRALESIDHLPGGREKLNDRDAAQLETLNRSLTDLLTVSVTLGGSNLEYSAAMRQVLAELRSTPDAIGTTPTDAAHSPRESLPLADIAVELAGEARDSAASLLAPARGGQTAP